MHNELSTKFGILRETCGGRLREGCWGADHMRGVLNAAREIGVCDTCLVQSSVYLACKIWQTLEHPDSQELLGYTWDAFEILRTLFGLRGPQRQQPERLGVGVDGRIFTGPNIGFTPCYPDHCDDPEAHRLQLVDVFHGFVLREKLCALCAIDLMLFVAVTGGQGMGMEEAECLVCEVETTLLELESFVSVGN